MLLAAQLLGEGRLPGTLLLLPRQLRRGLGHLACHQRLEPRPGDPTVGGLGHARIHVGGLRRLEVPGLADHVPCVRRPHLTGLHALPQLRVTVVQIQGVGHELPRRPHRPPDPRSERRGRELGHLRHPRSAQPSSLLPPRLGRLHGVQPLRRVQHRPLVRRTQQVDLRAPRGLVTRVGEVEDLVLRHLLQRCSIDHGPSQRGSTDNGAADDSTVWIPVIELHVVDDSWADHPGIHRHGRDMALGRGSFSVPTPRLPHPAQIDAASTRDPRHGRAFARSAAWSCGPDSGHELGQVTTVSRHLDPARADAPRRAGSLGGMSAVRRAVPFGPAGLRSRLGSRAR